MRQTGLLPALLLGGLVGCALLPDREAPPPAEFARIRGIVMDSITRSGVLPGATIAIPSLSRFTRSDDAGRFRFDSLPPGVYSLVASHPALDSARLYEIRANVRASGGRIADVVLSTPSPAAVYASVCGEEWRGFGVSGMVLGVLREAGNGKVLDGAEVRLRWSEWLLGERVMQEQRSAVVSVDSGGHFAICGDFADANLELQAVQGARRSGIVVLPPDGTLLRARDIHIGEDTSVLVLSATGDSLDGLAADTLMAILEASGSGVVEGMVSSAASPIEGAVVEMAGVALQVRTDASGRFRLAGIPLGTHTLIVRALGFSPTVRTMTVGNGADSRVAIDLSRTVQTLDVVQVLGSRSVRSMHRDELVQRTKTGQTKLVDVEMVRRVGLSGALRMQPFVYRLGSGTDRYVAFRVGSTYCLPAIFVDGVALPRNMVNVPNGFDLDFWVPPEEIAAVEFVRGSIPAAFQSYMMDGAEMQGGMTCGVIAIWRK